MLGKGGISVSQTSIFMLESFVCHLVAGKCLNIVKILRDTFVDTH